MTTIAHRRAARAGLVAGALLALASLPACQRKTNIVLIPADSTQAAANDSATMAVRTAQELWDAGDSAAAAAATAHVLAIDLAGRPPGAWRDRAGALFDSLGIGGEFADAPCALFVNLFSRSDPDNGSWPYLLWCGQQSPGVQAVEGKNLHLIGLVSRGLVRTGVGADSARVVAASFSRRAAGGVQPLVMTWRLAAKGAERWSLAQTLGADSLGGFGTASFESVSDTSADLVTRTYRTPPNFVECATCPHAYATSRWHWSPQGFVRTDRQPVPSPYGTFAAFIQSLVAGDRLAASERLADPVLVNEAITLEWNVRKGSWRPAPGADETPLAMTFYRGQKDAYTVHFRQQGQDWVITGFEPVTRTVE